MTSSTTGFRARRSVLYMPSSNERALEKAKTLPVDALILDLEDAVAPDAKPQARLNAAAAVTSGEYGAKELTIRINGADTEWHADDLAAAAEAGPAAIVVPKVNSADAVRSLVDSFDRAGVPASRLKSEKRSNLQVHGRTGAPCPVCGDTIRQVTYADSDFQYCPTCQTGGKPLADRVLSRLLK